MEAVVEPADPDPEKPVELVGGDVRDRSALRRGDDLEIVDEGRPAAGRLTPRL